jgi:hypothetical protein
MHRDHIGQLRPDPLIKLGVVVHGDHYLVRALVKRRGDRLGESFATPQAVAGNDD